ncbi:zeta toxin family protein [Patescibacteria group bacterium]|nr:zeta toxin family protein [Patescibacteria group bacterium]
MNYGICRNEEEAISWVKRNKRFIKDKFASIKDYPPVDKPFTIFMAGAPGAGKTEFSKLFIERFYESEKEKKVVRLDTDEIREIIPGYYGYNASIFQNAAALGMEYLIDKVYGDNQSALVDTTFGLKHKAISNVERALKRNRKVAIFYLYQNPQISWSFVKNRILQGLRYLPKDFFIKNFFLARENANEVKKTFKEQVVLAIFVLNEKHNIIYYEFDIDNINNHVKIHYTKDWLQKNLK